MNISQFKSVREMLSALDDFMYRCKSTALRKVPLRHALIATLSKFLAEHNLDSDQHNFVDCSKEPKVPKVNTSYSSLLQSREPCDYCIDRKHKNCAVMRNTYFPLCFSGKPVMEKSTSDTQHTKKGSI